MGACVSAWRERMFYKCPGFFLIYANRGIDFKVIDILPIITPRAAVI